MSQVTFSKLVFSPAASWVFRLSAIAAVVLFVAFVYPSLDFSAEPNDIGVGFPTFMTPFVLAFILCFLTAAFIVLGRVAVTLYGLYGGRSNGT